MRQIKRESSIVNTARFIFPLLAVLFACTSTMAYNLSHRPFSPDLLPPSFPLIQCESVDLPETNVATTAEFSVPGNPEFPRIRLGVNADPDTTSVELLSPDGVRLFGPTNIADSVTFGGHRRVYCADLNGDGRPDFVVYVWLGGCGLASGYENAAFLLSADDGYKCTVLTELWPDIENDFVDLNGDGSCEHIHTSFIYGMEGRDGLAHNYWVYNLVKFEGADVVEANGQYPGFPKWIWYTFDENHNPTVQLTSKQKKDLWSTQGEIWWKPASDGGSHRLDLEGDPVIGPFEGAATNVAIGNRIVRIMRDVRLDPYGRLDILEDRRPVFSHSGHMLSLEQEFHDPERLIAGEDITGDNIPNLVFYDWSGGAHCCMTMYILSLGKTIQPVAEIHGAHSCPMLKDLDEDGIPEVVMNDWTFAYWKSWFSDSPAPTIILRHEKGRYVVDLEKMRKPAPTGAQLRATAETVRSVHRDEDRKELLDKFGMARCDLWREMLELIYTGNDAQAWRLLDMAWPFGDKAREQFQQEFRMQLFVSPAWDALIDLNNRPEWMVKINTPDTTLWERYIDYALFRFCDTPVRPIGAQEWQERVDAAVGVTDPRGHGPDTGSEEWLRAVHWLVRNRVKKW